MCVCVCVCVCACVGGEGHSQTAPGVFPSAVYPFNPRHIKNSAMGGASYDKGSGRAIWHALVDGHLPFPASPTLAWSPCLHG